jgi:predicted membrane channel-forming protein YqfA (hemolysin III family)
MNRIERHKLARQVKRLSIILWVLMALIIILIIAFMATTIAGIYITILGVGLTTLAIVGVIPFSILITKQSKFQNEHKRIYKEN